MSPQPAIRAARQPKGENEMKTKLQTLREGVPTAALIALAVVCGWYLYISLTLSQPSLF